MLSWDSILYGATLAALARPRQPAIILTGALATAAGPLAWNAILRATHASQFFTDAPCACYRPAGKTPARACSPSPPPPCSSGSGRWPPLRPGARLRWPRSAAWPRSWSTSTCTDQPGLDGCHPGRGGGDGAAWRRGASVRRARRMPAGRQLASSAAWASLLIAGCQCPRRRPVRCSWNHRPVTSGSEYSCQVAGALESTHSARSAHTRSDCPGERDGQPASSGNGPG